MSPVILDELLAREAIRHTMSVYNTAGDRGRVDELATAFTPDGVLEFGGDRFEGRAAIIARLAAVDPTRADALDGAAGADGLMFSQRRPRSRASDAGKRCIFARHDELRVVALPDPARAPGAAVADDRRFEAMTPRHEHSSPGRARASR